MITYMKTYALQLLVLLTALIMAGAGYGDAAMAAMPAMLLNTNPFPIIPELQAVAIAYRNPRLIADDVLPRVDVNTKEFKYMKYPKGTFFTVPDTKVGRKGTPNQVEMEGEDATEACDDHALDDVVPVEDVEAARANPNRPDPLMRSTEFVTDLIQLAREVRTANLVFAPAQYANGNKVQLTSNDRWDTGHADSDPVEDIQAGLDAVIMRPNIMVIGRLAWTKLSMHSKIAAAIFKQGTTAGIASRQQVADLFELDEILVGEGFVNTAKKGQAPTIERAWGKHCLLAHRNRNADSQRGTTYGFTAQWGQRIAGSMAEPKTGMRGSERVRVGESVKELLTANDLAYFIEDVIS